MLADVVGHGVRLVVPRPARERAAGRGYPVPGWWLAACAAAAAVTVVAAAAVSLLGSGGLGLGPLLAVPVALAGVGAPGLRVPLACGAVMLAAAVVLAAFAPGSLLPIVTGTSSVVAVTALTGVGVVLNGPGRRELAGIGPVERKLADVTSVAEVVQRALLPPLPRRVGPLELEAVPLAAAAEARVGGDLYEVARTPFGIRLIVGDARGKGLDAVETAAGVLGVFREVAHEVYTLAEAARRPGGALLLYTDGVTEARDSRRRCYPLAARLAGLAASSTGEIRPDLLECLRDDLLRHAGGPLDDDAALVLVRAPAAWSGAAPRPAPAIAP